MFCLRAAAFIMIAYVAVIRYGYADCYMLARYDAYAYFAVTPPIHTLLARCYDIRHISGDGALWQRGIDMRASGCCYTLPALSSPYMRVNVATRRACRCCRDTRLFAAPMPLITPCCSHMQSSAFTLLLRCAAIARYAQRGASVVGADISYVTMSVIDMAPVTR